VTNPSPAVPAWLLAAAEYRRNGWSDTLPLPTGQKFPPPAGHTGYAGATVTDLELAGWAAEGAYGNLALRLPPGVVGIDVDAYGEKAGQQTIAKREREWGRLPTTWRTTSRWPDDGDSGIRLFRAPSGLAWINPGPGVEIIHVGWRYAVAWPSRHPNGRVYCWVDEDSGMVEAAALPVRPEDLPELPREWVLNLSPGPAVERVRGDAGEVPGEWMTTGTCLRVTKQLANGLGALDDPSGESRHDVMLRVVLAIVGYGSKGHQGVGNALEQLERRFIEVIEPVRGRSAHSEWQRIVQGAVAVVVADESMTEHCGGASCEPGLAKPLPDELVALAMMSNPAVAAGRVEVSALLSVQGGEALGGEQEPQYGGPLYSDLSWILSGEPPVTAPPSVMTTKAGHSVFYAGRINGIFGDPESAKTWIAMAAMAEVLARGGKAAFVDVDHNGAVELATRLHWLGAGDVNIADPNRLRIYNPEGSLEVLGCVADIVEFGAEIAVFDSIGELIPMLGLKSTDNDDITLGIRRVLAPPARAGAAVIGIDHLPKSAEAKGNGYAIGGTAKKRAVDGAYLLAEVIPGKQPAPGKSGEVRLRIEKDRPGELRRAVKGAIVGRFVIDSTNPSGIISWEIRPVEMASDGKEMPTYVMERISTWAKTECTDATIPSTRALFEWGKENDYGRPTLERAIAELLSMGYFAEVGGDKNRKAFHLVRPFHAVRPRSFDAPAEADDE
jgi:hypothetical protein